MDRSRRLAFLLVAAGLGGCMARPIPVPATTRQPNDVGPTIRGSATTDPSPARTGPSTWPALAQALTCPGDQWPPADLTAIQGITAVAVDRAAILVRNATTRTWYLKLSGWEAVRLDTCVGLVESEVVRGPITAGTEQRLDLSYLASRPDVPLTIAFWDAPCGEACARRPGHPLLVDGSPIEPGSS